MVFTICGVTRMDMVARSRWSRSMLSAKSSGSNVPSAAFSSRRFFSVCLRCQSALSQSLRVAFLKPAMRFQSGSSKGRSSGYRNGCTAPEVASAGVAAACGTGTGALGGTLGFRAGFGFIR